MNRRNRRGHNLFHLNRIQQLFHFSKRIAEYRVGLLSKREKEVACGLAFGMDLYQIAKAMRVTHRTVREFAERVFRKFVCKYQKNVGIARIWFMGTWTPPNSRRGPYVVPEWVAQHIHDYNRWVRMDDIAEVYVDGGVVQKNPSVIGGTWACVFLRSKELARTKEDREISRQSGFIAPAEAGLPAVTNNYTELLAAVEAMERLPDLWSGPIFTDSFVTLCRLTSDTPKMVGIPDDLQGRMWQCRHRLGKLEVCLLDGHPTKKQLKRGIGKRGNRCSEWNVLVDKLCGEEADKAMLRLATDEKIVPASQPADWEECKHDFPGSHETIREPNFGVAIGSRRVCRLCQAVEYDDWSETRSSGGTPRIYPPEQPVGKPQEVTIEEWQESVDSAGPSPEIVP